MSPIPRIPPIVRSFDGCRPKIDPSAWVAPGATVVGDVELAAGVSVWYGAVVRGDLHQVRIGARTNVQDGAIVHVTAERFPAFIGEEVTVGHRAVVHGCRVGDGALVGIGAIVLDGAVVGEEALIGAGAIVTPGSEIPARTLAIGVPAKPVRELTREERREQRERTLRYVETARLHAASEDEP